METRKYSLETMLKIENNPQTQSITVSGQGLGTPLKFTPAVTELGPILPFSPSGDISVITVTSACDIPLEFYSLDFDTVYKEEQQLLSAIDTYDQDGILRTEPREAGQY